MSELKSQEQLRDDITTVLELSRSSWKSPPEPETSAAEEFSTPKFFPRSMLFKTLNNHPLASAVAIGSVWYLGPARFGALAVTGASLLLRHRLALIPIATQLASSRLFKARPKRNLQQSSPNNRETV